MKDPLNKWISSYDILDVNIDADKNTIIEAFKKALSLRKYDQQQIANARKTLLDPEMRIQEEFFFYDMEDEKELKIKVSKKSQDSPLFDNRDIVAMNNFDNLNSQLLQEDT